MLLSFCDSLRSSKCHEVLPLWGWQSQSITCAAVAKVGFFGQQAFVEDEFLGVVVGDDYSLLKLWGEVLLDCLE